MGERAMDRPAIPSVKKVVHGPTSARQFMFATGIENSYPTVYWEGKTVRRDGMELSGHYDQLKEDFGLVKDLGIQFLRYGPPYYQVHAAPGRYHWDFADETFNALREMDIHPITDLCHFGVPDWVGSFQNPEWPELFAHYAKAFANRFPWVKLYTPVNEIFICAQWSGLRGWWNERLTSDRGFVTALKNMCRANVLAEEEILKVQPEALFVQSESTSYFHQHSPEAHHAAYLDNQKRFLALDLCYGNDTSGLMYEYLREHGMTKEEYHWFLQHGRAMTPHCIMGNDYYDTNEYTVKADGSDGEQSGEIFGYYVITHQYFDRYHLPVMHTETNVKDDEDRGPHWLHKEWANVVRLKQDGVPILGFTWYSLIDQTDWDTGLREVNYRTVPCGLFDKDRHIHPVGRAYKQLIAQWRDRLPLDSMCRDTAVMHGPIEG